MASQSSIADINIHLRARAVDKNLIDRAAEIVGSNRSQFMISSALREAKNVLLDQSTIFADAKTFQKMLSWMDGAPTRAEKSGMTRLIRAKSLWHDE